MPRKTLRERALAHCYRINPKTPGWLSRFFVGAYLAGHRANRLTRAERAVVEAARKWSVRHRLEDTVVLIEAVKELERAKRRK